MGCKGVFVTRTCFRDGRCGQEQHGRGAELTSERGGIGAEISEWSLLFFLEDTSNTTCTMEMYGNDLAAYWACKTQFAHQSNWFPSPIAGLFSYEVNKNCIRISILLTYRKFI